MTTLSLAQAQRCYRPEAAFIARPGKGSSKLWPIWLSGSALFRSIQSALSSVLTTIFWPPGSRLPNRVAGPGAGLRVLGAASRLSAGGISALLQERIKAHGHEQVSTLKKDAERCWNGSVPKALMARHFEAPAHEGWWDWKPAKRALEYLFMAGDLMVVRQGFPESV